MELFEACRQQPSDLARKEMCRSRLQQDINRVYAGGFGILCSFQDYSRENDSPSVFFPVARLYLTGSSMNELGCRSSDADLCLVTKGNVSKAASRHHNQNDLSTSLVRYMKPFVFVSEKTQSTASAVCSPEVVWRTVWVFIPAISNFLNYQRDTTNLFSPNIVCSP